MCVFEGEGCLVVLFIAKALGGKLNRISFLHFTDRESGGTSNKGECFPFVFSNQGAQKRLDYTLVSWATSLVWWMLSALT